MECIVQTKTMEARVKSSQLKIARNRSKQLKKNDKKKEAKIKLNKYHLRTCYKLFQMFLTRYHGNSARLKRRT